MSTMQEMIRSLSFLNDFFVKIRDIFEDELNVLLLCVFSGFWRCGSFLIVIVRGVFLAKIAKRKGRGFCDRSSRIVEKR